MDYIKLFRSLKNWEWFTDINTCHLYIYMLLSVNWKEGNFKGLSVPEGTFISSIGKMAAETGLTVDEVRTAIKHLEKSKNITKQATNKYTVFTVLGWDKYQDVPKQIPNKSQTIPKPFPTIEESKEGKKERNNKTFVPPTVLDVAEYCVERGNHVDANAFVDFYTANGWVQGKGKPIKDWKAAVRTWERKEERRAAVPSNKFNSFRQNEYDFDSLEKYLLSN